MAKDVAFPCVPSVPSGPPEPSRAAARPESPGPSASEGPPSLAVAASCSAEPDEAPACAGPALDAVVARGLAAAREAGMRAAIATLPIAALLVDRDGHTLEVNPAARAIVDGGVLFLGLAGELRCRIPHDDAAIGRSLAGAIASGAAEVLKVSDFGGGGDVLVAVVPLHGGDRAALLLLPQVGDAGALARTLAALYRLDVAQTDMALAFHRGERIDAVAARTGRGCYAASITRMETLERLGAADAGSAARKVSALARLLPPSRVDAPVLGRTG